MAVEPSIKSDREERIDEIVFNYMKAVELGQRPDRQEILDSHPDLADELARFFANQDRMNPFDTTLLPSIPIETVSENELQFFGDYKVDGILGEGGMGEVYRVLDPDFNRTLAVKVLRKEHQGRADLEVRFLEEAHVLGQLQHPGIVPVHEIGRLDDGRPFFAMKLVKGQTLERLLQERPRPDHDLPRFLAIFEQICQTMANAHAHGVIHRDLKPSNVMVGAFGEVQVMDWGLAKVLDPKRKQSDAAAPSDEKQSLIATIRSETHGQTTQAGCRMGSPQFMPPEQALGEVDRHDERSDVFMLGGVLCVILTGHAPYEGTTAFGAQQRGELQPAYDRLAACGVDGELIELTKACLRADREARPRDGGTVAERVAGYQSGVRERLRRSEIAKAAAEVKAKEERKRRRLAVALAGAIGIWLLAAGGLGARHWYQQHQLDVRVQLTVDMIERLREDARAQGSEEAAIPTWAHLEQECRYAQDFLTAGASANVQDRLGTLIIEVRQEAETVRQRLAEKRKARDHHSEGQRLLELKKPVEAAEEFRKAIRAWEQFAAAHIGLGEILQVDDPVGAEHEFRRAIQIEPDHIGAHTKLGLLLLQARRPAEAETEFREVNRYEDQLHADALERRRLLPRSATSLNQVFEETGNYFRAESHFDLGVALSMQNRPSEAEQEYRVALAAIAPLHEETGKNPWSSGQGKGIYAPTSGKNANLQQSQQAMSNALHARDVGKYFCALGAALRDQSRFTEALTAYRSGHELLGQDNGHLPFPVGDWVKECDYLVRVEPKLALVLDAQAKPKDTQESIEFGYMCLRYRHLYATSARFYMDAFQDDPRFADDLVAEHRYNATRAALIASAAKSGNAANLDLAQRARLRRQALDWLCADLTAWTWLAAESPRSSAHIAKTLTHWQEDPDLAGVRDLADLQKLSDEERRVCEKLWSDVAELVKRLEKNEK